MLRSESAATSVSMVSFSSLSHGSTATQRTQLQQQVQADEMEQLLALSIGIALHDKLFI